MDSILVGIVTNSAGPESPLASAVRLHPDIEAVNVTLDDPAPKSVAGLVVDLPVAGREPALARLGSRWQVPILVETPVAIDREQAAAAIKHFTRASLVALNPLRYWLPLRRLTDEVGRNGDSVETVYAAWRFRADQSWDHALPQLVDYVSHLCGSHPARIAAMARPRPNVLLVTLRYQNDAVASLELGQHLPAASSLPSTFLLECFCRNQVYHATPDQQAISIVSSDPAEHDWSPGPEMAMVDSFVQHLRQPHVFTASGEAELDLLWIRDEILIAAAQGEVRIGSQAEAPCQ